jgi:outer membrane PBP1 activator LpoA protein
VSDAKVVTVGLIGVTLRDATTAQIACGHQGVRPVVVAEIGVAAGQRFYEELTKIREALEAAHAVLVERAKEGGAATSAEFHLARVLNDLEMTGDWQETLLDWATRHSSHPAT